MYPWQEEKLKCIHADAPFDFAKCCTSNLMCVKLKMLKIVYLKYIITF